MSDTHAMHTELSAETLNKMASKKLKSYTIGFIALVISTLVGYIAVTTGLSSKEMFTVISAVMVFQLLAIVAFFFKNNVSDEDATWNLISFLFTLLIAAVVVCGSLWIMYNLNYNMVH